MKSFFPCCGFAGRSFQGRFRCTSLVILGALLSIGELQGVSPFEEGNGFFKEGKYPSAEEAYNRSLALEGDTPSTRYNLGKVREALGDPGGAMLEWERALRLEPQNAAALKSLATARTTVSSRPDPERWWLNLQPLGAAGKEHWILAGGAWLALAGFRLLWSKNHRPEGLAALLAGFFVALLGFGWLRHSLAEADMALVRARSIVFRAAPADPARALEALNAGTRLQLLDESGGWSRCRLSDGLTGWVPSSAIERISPAK
jgi:tetratricopeptide (TPR) repeat protein